MAFLSQVINARQNQLKNSGIPGDIFNLEDLLTVVSLEQCSLRMDSVHIALCCQKNA